MSTVVEESDASDMFVEGGLVNNDSKSYTDIGSSVGYVNLPGIPDISE